MPHDSLDRPVLTEVVITDAMAAAATAALIKWYEGLTDFRDGGRYVLDAGMAARGEFEHLLGSDVRRADH